MTLSINASQTNEQVNVTSCYPPSILSRWECRFIDDGPQRRLAFYLLLRERDAVVFVCFLGIRSIDDSANIAHGGAYLKVKGVGEWLNGQKAAFMDWVT